MQSRITRKIKILLVMTATLALSLTGCYFNEKSIAPEDKLWITATDFSPYLELDMNKVRLYELDALYYGEDVKFDHTEPANRMIIVQCLPDENGIFAFGTVRQSLSVPRVDVDELYTQKFRDKAAEWLPGCTPR